VPAQLTINAPHVVHETIDGETILIHLGTGTYYSLDGAGAEVWRLVLDGVPGDALAAAMQIRYDADPKLVGTTVASLVDELVAEGLLVSGRPEPSEAEAEAEAEAGDADDAAEAASAIPFVAPVLHKYTDMQEFMLVDPLHDVEADAGWPHVKAG
jgi:Coenzyme PQQ synthesis protein D (PqqD)